jgi:hypothetical protein
MAVPFVTQKVRDARDPLKYQDEHLISGRSLYGSKSSNWILAGHLISQKWNVSHI